MHDALERGDVWRGKGLFYMCRVFNAIILPQHTHTHKIQNHDCGPSLYVQGTNYNQIRIFYLSLVGSLCGLRGEGGEGSEKHE